MAIQPRKKGAGKRVEGTLKIRTPAKGKNGDNLSSVAEDLVTEVPEANIRAVRNKIEEAFSAFGSDKLPGTIIPAGARNNSKEAAEYVLADLLKKLAEKRHKLAQEAAEKAGVFGDKSSYVEGDTVMVFNDPNFSINVKKGSPTKMIGKEEVQAALVKHLGKKADEVLEECYKPRAATTQIIVSMK